MNICLIIRSSTVGTIPASILQQGNATAAATSNGRANTMTGKMVTYSTTELRSKKPLKVSSSLKSIMVNSGSGMVRSPLTLPPTINQKVNEDY
jgi:hypothetical protein